jgi:hypothetical protein
MIARVTLYIDVALGQMKPSSPFFTDLHESLDAKIPYAIIAGNTSLLAADHSQKEKANIHSQPNNRQPVVVAVEVPCDHLTYFSNEASDALAETLP